MAVVTETKDRMVIPNMEKQEWLPARILDHWYRWDVKKKYKEKVSIIDQLVLRFAMDPDVVPGVDVGGKASQRWFDSYQPVNGQRYATEEFCGRIHKTIKEWLKDDDGNPLLDQDGKKRFHLKEVPYEVGELIMSKDDYSRFVLDYSGTIPVHIDDTGAPDIYIGPKHGIYIIMAECWDDDFRAALAGSTFTVESLMNLQVQIMTKHGSLRDDGTRWENLDKMRPGKPDQNVPAPEGYVRVKDRVDDTPF